MKFWPGRAGELECLEGEGGYSIRVDGDSRKTQGLRAKRLGIDHWRVHFVVMIDCMEDLRDAVSLMCGVLNIMTSSVLALDSAS